jgi:Rrf2 family transcriptional regulator, iron-sulfur cluster assembly transcription factor
MLSRSALYALQAALHLAQKSNGPSESAARMADRLGVPSPYLAKVLRQLSLEGILESSRGARGGYRLARPPDTLTVAEVVRAFEEVTTPETCLLGGPCRETHPCAAHLRRLEWNAARERILAETTLSELLPHGSGSAPESRRADGSDTT